MSATEEYATYVWTDPGQFGAWLTSEERYALLDIFCFYPRDDADWTRLTNNDPRVPVYLTGGTKARFVEIANQCRDVFLGGIRKLAERANYRYPDGVAETLLKYWVPGRVSVSSDHDYYPSWK